MSAVSDCERKLLTKRKEISSLKEKLTSAEKALTQSTFLTKDLQASSMTKDTELTLGMLFNKELRIF